MTSAKHTPLTKHAVAKVRRQRRVRAQAIVDALAKELGREPTFPEIAKRLGELAKPRALLEKL